MRDFLAAMWWLLRFSALFVGVGVGTLWLALNANTILGITGLVLGGLGLALYAFRSLDRLIDGGGQS